MDKVLGDIRLSPFVVADFTEHRNGVYLEAGFARGLGLRVVHTCRKDHMDKAHFDTAHSTTLFGKRRSSYVRSSTIESQALLASGPTTGRPKQT